MIKQCKICNEEKEIHYGLAGIGMVCKNCYYSYMDEYKKVLEGLLIKNE
jgi:hypothetical protein